MAQIKKRSKKRGDDADQPKGAMLHKGKAAHPGLERDNKGDAIPMPKRLAEDRAKARRASRSS